MRKVPPLIRTLLMSCLTVAKSPLYVEEHPAQYIIYFMIILGLRAGAQDPPLHLQVDGIVKCVQVEVLNTRSTCMVGKPIPPSEYTSNLADICHWSKTRNTECLQNTQAQVLTNIKAGVSNSKPH